MQTPVIDHGEAVCYTIIQGLAEIVNDFEMRKTIHKSKVMTNFIHHFDTTFILKFISF